MKITDVEIFDVHTDPKDFDIPWHPILARINTDEGLNRVGEAG